MDPIASPVRLGLPAKFDSWREGQQEIIIDGLRTEKRVRVQVVPTGGGKSICYMAMGLHQGRTVILTSTKGLQDQLEAEFGSLITVVKGQSAYKCRRMPQVTCNRGPCHWGAGPCPIRALGQCEYHGTIEVAKRSPMVATNYAFWFANEPDTLGKFDFLVCDEAHDSVEVMLDSLGVEITKWDTDRYLPWPGPDKPMGHYLDWAEILAFKVEDRIDELKKRREATLSPEGAKLLDLKMVLSKLNRVTEDNWVCDYRGKVIKFDPIWPGHLTEPYLLRDIPKVLFTSATVNRKTIEIMGIPNSDVAYKEYPSTFPLARRPVYWIPTVRMDHRIDNAGMGLWLSRIDQIIWPRIARKGVIHTVSYERMQRIINTSDYRGIMLHHTRQNTMEMVGKFKEAPPPSILVSPSVVTGYDFPYDECEWQIIGKVPFPDGRSKVMKARQDLDPEYSTYITMQALVQACGRGMRAPDDRCECFIIDDHAQWFLNKAKHLAPDWFLKAIRRSNTIPGAI